MLLAADLAQDEPLSQSWCWHKLAYLLTQNPKHSPWSGLHGHRIRSNNAVNVCRQQQPMCLHSQHHGTVCLHSQHHATMCLQCWHHATMCLQSQHHLTMCLHSQHHVTRLFQLACFCRPPVWKDSPANAYNTHKLRNGSKNPACCLVDSLACAEDVTSHEHTLPKGLHQQAFGDAGIVSGI